MDKQYFIVKNGEQQGPYSLEQLRQQGITSETLVWAEGMDQWMAAWQVSELRDIINHRQSAATPPPPPVGQPEYVQQPSAAPAPHKGSTHTWRWVVVAVVVLLGVVMAATNPSREKHAEVIKENVRKGITRALTDGGDGLFAQGLGMLSNMIAGPIVDEIVDQQIDYHNYLLWSTTTISNGKKDVTISYGLFGCVFTASEEKIAEGISKEINSAQEQQQSASTGFFGDQETEDDPAASATPEDQPTDADESLSRAIGIAVIDHLGKQLKKGIKENADSTVSEGVGNIIDDVIDLIKK